MHPRLLPRSFSCLGILIFSVLQQALAQGDCGSTGVTTTINDQAEATALSDCSTYSGSIAIGESASGGISLDGITEIFGDLVVHDVFGIISLSSETIRHIDGKLDTKNATLLSTLTFPVLFQVGEFSVSAMPAISNFNFSTGISSVKRVLITNTFLSTLEGVNITNADSVDINNNNRLRTISLPLITANTEIIIAFNGKEAEVDLHSLTSVGSIELHNISSLSIPELSLVSADFVIVGSFLVNLAADALTVITKNLSVTSNPSIESIAFPNLISAGSISITNNTALETIGFDQLTKATDIDISNFTNITMGALGAVSGSFILASTDPDFNCSTYDAVQSAIPDYSCLGTHQKIATSSSASSTAGSTSSPTSDSSSTTAPASNSKSGLSAGAKAGIAIAAVIVGLVAGIGLFFWRRRGKKVTPVEEVTGIYGKPEMDSNEVPRKEIGTGLERHELGNEHGVSEVGNNEPEESYELPGESAPPKRRDSAEQAAT